MDSDGGARDSAGAMWMVTLGEIEVNDRGRGGSIQRHTMLSLSLCSLPAAVRVCLSGVMLDLASTLLCSTVIKPHAPGCVCWVLTRTCRVLTPTSSWMLTQAYMRVVLTPTLTITSIPWLDRILQQRQAICVGDMVLPHPGQSNHTMSRSVCMSAVV